MNEIETEQLCDIALGCFRDGIGGLEHLPPLIEKIIDNRAWERRRIRTGAVVECGSLAELITAKPLKGWGESAEKVEAVLKSHPAVLAKFRNAMKRKANQHTCKVDNVTPPQDRQQKGNSKAYTCERLMRDAPELFAEVEAGRLSANAAAIAAGIRKKPSQAEIAVKAFRKAENRLEAMRLMIDAIDDVVEIKLIEDALRHKKNERLKTKSRGDDTDTAMADALWCFESTPKKRWGDLMTLKRMFLSQNFVSVCRRFIALCQEANEAHAKLGYKSPAEMLAKGYELNPDQVEAVLRVLESSGSPKHRAAATEYRQQSGGAKT
jgi:hypothetical protein